MGTIFTINLEILEIKEIKIQEKNHLEVRNTVHASCGKGSVEYVCIVFN